MNCEQTSYLEEGRRASLTPGMEDLKATEAHLQ